MLLLWPAGTAKDKQHQQCNLFYYMELKQSATRLSYWSKLCVQVISFGKVKGTRCLGKPGIIWNSIVMSELIGLNIRCPYCGAQDKPAWHTGVCDIQT